MSQVHSSLTGTLRKIIPDVGDDVFPNGGGEINLAGGNNITVTGDNVSHTLTIDVTGTTDRAVQIGNATGSLTSLAVGTNGQVLLASTAADPAFATLTSVGGSIIFTPGANTLNLEAAAYVEALQQQIYYVGKHGNDANTGVNIENAVLTFGQAIVLATAAVPSAVNRFSITCLDDGIYAEALTVPQYVDVFAPRATLSGTLVVNDDSSIKFSRLNVADATIGILKTAGSTYTNVEIDYVTCLVGGIGLISLSGFVNMNWKEMYVADGFGVGDLTSAVAHIHIKGGDLYITGTGTGIARANTGSILGRVDHIADIGAGVGTGIAIFDGSVDININTLDCDTAYNVNGATSILRLYANSITGTRTLAAGGQAKIWTPLRSLDNGELVIGSTGTDPVVASITSTGSTITITPGAGSLNIDTAASVATSYLTDDTNSATPALGVLTISGGTNLQSASAGSTVTLNVDSDLVGITSITASNGGEIRTGTTAADTLLLRAYDNNTGPGYVTFATLTAGNTPTMDLSDSVTKAGNYIYRAGGTDVPIADGGTGVSTLALHGILMGNGATDIQATAEPSDGQLLIGSTGNFPVLSSLTAGAGISITPGAGSISIAATAVGFAWSAVTVDAGLTVNTGTIANKAGLLTMTLPATAALGDVLEFTNLNTAVGLRIAQNANQYIRVSGSLSTTGIAGYVESTQLGDSLKLLCVVAGASTGWQALNSVGNWTIA